VISGSHVILYSSAPDEARALLRDVFELESVDAGGGWLIFALPPAEIAVHPTGPDGGEEGRAELYLMCEDIEATAAALAERGVELARPVSDEGWGLFTTIELPGGGELGLYQPLHPLPPRATGG